MNALKMLELCLTVSVIIFDRVMGDLTCVCFASVKAMMLIIDCKYRLTGKEQRYTPSSHNKTPHNKANGLAEETEDLLLEDSVTSKASLVQVEEPYIPKVGKPYIPEVPHKPWQIVSTCPLPLKH